MKFLLSSELSVGCSDGDGSADNNVAIADNDGNGVHDHVKSPLDSINPILLKEN